LTATRLDGARTFPGLINERLDRVGAAAAFCGAAKRSVDPAYARRGRRACDDASHVRIAEDIAGTDDHRELSPGYRVNGSANGISRAEEPRGPHASVMSEAPSECLVAKAGA
jgi:hypothetical protein